MDKKEKNLIIVFFSIILLIVIVLIFNFINKDEITFTSEKPKISLKSDDVNTMNKEIQQLINVNTYSEILYSVTENDDYLSLVIQITDGIGITTYPKFISYNFDKKTKKLLSNDEILIKFNYDSNYVIEQIKNKLNQYYEEEIKQGYVDGNECDFDCYLGFVRNITDLEESYVLAINKDKLITYVSFDTNSLLEDQVYFEKIKNPHRVDMK